MTVNEEPRDEHQEPEADDVPESEELDVEGPNESAPGHRPDEDASSDEA